MFSNSIIKIDNVIRHFGYCNFSIVISILITQYPHEKKKKKVKFKGVKIEMYSQNFLSLLLSIQRSHST